jgi:hypothetical protein
MKMSPHGKQIYIKRAAPVAAGQSMADALVQFVLIYVKGNAAWRRRKETTPYYTIYPSVLGPLIITRIDCKKLYP